MKAVILAGGAGTRLRPLTEELPKPLVPFLGEPLLFRIIRQLIHVGIHEIIITVGYRGEQIKNTVQAHDFGPDCLLRFSEEDHPLGTAGCVFHCKEFITEDTLIISGDCVIDTDLRDFIHDFNKQDGLVSIAASSVEDPREFGTLLTDEQHFVRAFVEKPMWDQVCTDLVSTGIYIIRPEIIEIIASLGKANCDFAKDIFPLLLEKQKKIRVYELSGFWCDVGSPESYLNACLRLSPSGENSNVFWDHVTVGANSLVRNSVLCDRVLVGENVIIQNSFIGNQVVIEDHACVVNAKVDGHIRIAQGTTITGIVQKRTELPNNCNIGDGELVGELSYDFLLKLCGCIAMFFEDGATIAVVCQRNSRASVIGVSVQAGLLACGREIKEGKGISLPAMRWMIRKGICDGGVYITDSRIKLLNGNGNDLNRSERRRFHGIYSKTKNIRPIGNFYSVESIQNPEEYYYSELIHRFPCAYRSLDYFGKKYTAEERNGLIAQIVLALYPDAPIFVPSHNGLTAEAYAKEKGRYVVHCGEKPGDMMDEMEKLMHIPGVYEEYLMFTDDFALDLAACLWRETSKEKQSIDSKSVYTRSRVVSCPRKRCAAILRQIGAEACCDGNSKEDGLVFRSPKGCMHICADGEHDHLNIYVESFNEEYSDELMGKWFDRISSLLK